MAVGIGAAVAITAFSACIAPWLDRQNNQNGDDQESRAAPENPSKAVSQLQPESFKSLFINGLRKLSSVCLPSVDMTGSLQYFVSKPFLDIDINIISQSTQTDADSTYFTAASEETRSTYESNAFGESEKTHQMSSPSSSSRSSASALPQNQKILIPRIEKPPRAHPPRKSTDSAAVVSSGSVQETPVPKENLGNSKTKELGPIQHQSVDHSKNGSTIQHQSADPSEKDSSTQRQSADSSKNDPSTQHQSADPSKNDFLINKNDHDDPSSTIETSERPKTFEVVVTVHKDASTAADFDKNQAENSRVSFEPDHNNNSSLHDNYKNNLNYVSSMGRSFDHFVQSSNIGGSSAIIGRSSANIGGSSAIIGGSPPNIGGSSANIGGSSANIGGSSADIGRSSGNIGGSSANIGRSSSNIGGSSSNGKSHEEHHSSSLVTRIRVVLSRYFHFGEKSHKSRDASGRLKGMCSKVQTESSGSSSRTGDTIIHYPGKMSSCIVQDLNSENDKSRLSFSIAEVTSSTRIADEAAGAFDPVRDRSESPIESIVESKRIQNTRRLGFDQNRDKSGKCQGILSGGNFRNSRTTISNSGTEYPTFETKKGILRKLRGFFQRDKSKKLSFLGESKFRETFDGKTSDNYYGRSVLCTEL